MDKQIIIDKIKKLIALRDGAKAIGSEGEANAAAAAIHRLLTQYNLDMAEVYSSVGLSEAEHKESPIGRSSNFSTADSYRCGWKQSLLNVLCKYYYCKAYIISGTPYMAVYGTELNRMTVEYAFNFLTTVFTGLSARRYREVFIEIRVTPRQRDRWVASYLLGCVSGVDDKLRNEQTSECTGLMVCHEQMIEKYISETTGKTTGKWHSSSQRSLSGHAFSIGEKDGRRQQVAKAIK